METLRTRWTSRAYSDRTINRVFYHLARGITYDGIPQTQVREVCTWLRFFGLIDAKNHLTYLGKVIYRFDPYFEEELTKLICQFNFIKAPTLIREVFTRNFNEIEKNEFIHYVTSKYPKANPGSLERDYGVMINTYLYKPANPEDGCGFFTPFNLITQSGKRYYRKPVKLDYFDSYSILAFLAPLSGEIRKDDAFYKVKDAFNFGTIEFMEWLYKCKEIKVVSTAGLDLLYLPEKTDFLEYIEKSYLEKEKEFCF